MAANQPPWPRAWLMTDERIGDRLWQAIDALPAAEGGIVFRHYGLDIQARLTLGRQLAARSIERRLVLAVAGSRSLAAELGAKLVHNPDSIGAMPCSMAVHDEGQALAARDAGAALAFIAPLYPTRSHPDAPTLGAARAAELAAIAGCPAIALGGLNPDRFCTLDAEFPGAFHGFAGIDCWLKD